MPHDAADAPQAWPLGRLLATAARLAEHAFRAHLEEHDLTHAGLTVLHLLQGGPLGQVTLAERCRVQAQTMSQTVERLERSGYVRRARDPGDRRRLLVDLTGAGRRVYAAVGDPSVAVSAAFEDVEDPALFRRQLVTIIDRLAGERWPYPDDPPPGVRPRSRDHGRPRTADDRS
jgi:DNA-binding MarR family transcriptional regulator